MVPSRCAGGEKWFFPRARAEGPSRGESASPVLASGGGRVERRLLPRRGVLFTHFIGPSRYRPRVSMLTPAGHGDASRPEGAGCLARRPVLALFRGPETGSRVEVCGLHLRCAPQVSKSTIGGMVPGGSDAAGSGGARASPRMPQTFGSRASRVSKLTRAAAPTWRPGGRLSEAEKFTFLRLSASALHASHFSTRPDPVVAWNPPGGPHGQVQLSQNTIGGESVSARLREAASESGSDARYGHLGWLG